MRRSRALQASLTFLNKIIPKRNILLFNSYPPFSDNSLALYEYIIAHRPDITERYRLIWGQEKNVAIPDFLKKIAPKIVVKKTFCGITTFLTARYIFTTHGYFPGVRSGNGQVQVNLWHGCGYKAITETDSEYVGDINVVSGNAYVPIHEKVFHMKPGTVFPTGLPRNDVLFQHRPVLGCLGIHKEKYKKIYIWMPTYRKAKLGHEETDGSEESFTASAMIRQEVTELNETLQGQNSLLLVKPHPMDAKTFDNITGFDNIIAVTNEMLSEHGVRLYELLAETDGLLSDYSSVVTDYLLLEKPVVMVMSDMDAYKHNRGFVFDHIEDYIPGPVITNEKDLVHYFRHSDEIDTVWQRRRMELTHLFHDNLDNHSCERVCNLIFGTYTKES